MKVFKPKYAAAALSMCLMMGAQVAVATNFSWFNGQWAQAQSDLVPDARITFGHLDNGMRYAIIPNQNPPGRISVRLDVQVGSLMEAPDELGIAHYLEHMAFNGSKHFPAGSLIPFFQKHGMSFGGDTNAHTSYYETVYKLDLSKNDADSVAEGFKVLRDMADGLTLEPHEVDQERGIILSEKSARDSEAVQAGRQWRQFVFKGSRLTNDVIGTDETLAGIDAKKVRAFYEKWYVPSRMVLVVSGDVKGLNLSKLIENAFASMVNKPAAPIEDTGAIDRQGVKILVQKRPVSATSILIQIMEPEVTVADSQARWRDVVMGLLTKIAIDRRLVAQRLADPTVYSSASYRDSRLSLLTPSIMWAASTTADNWQKSLNALQFQLERAKRFGLTPAEFEQTKADVLKSFTLAVKQRSQATNASLADQFVSAVNTNTVFTSPESDLKLVQSILAKLTLQEVNAYLAQGLAPDNRRILVSGPVSIRDSDVRQAFDQFDPKAVTPPPTEVAAKFPYLAKTPAQAHVKWTQTTPLSSMPAIQLYETTLDNGLRIVLEPLTFQRGAVTATLIFGQGLSTTPDSQVKSKRIAYSVLGQQGVGKLDVRQTSELLGGKGLRIAESVGEFRQKISGSAPSDELPLLLEALYTQYQDPTLTSAALVRTAQLTKLSDFDRNHTVAGVLGQVEGAYLTGERPLTDSIEEADFKGLQVEALRAYIHEDRRYGDRTLFIAGDFDVEKAKRWAVERFSALDKPLPAKAQVQRAPTFPTQAKRVDVVDGDTLGSAVVTQAWHLDQPQPNDRTLSAVRQLAAAIMRERLRQEIRERLAISYSPSASYTELIDHGGYAYLKVQIQTKKDQVQAVENALDGLVKTILTTPITASELDRVRKPLLTSWSSRKQSNNMWTVLTSNALATGRPLLTWYEQMGPNYEAATPMAVQDALRAFLKAPSTTLVVESQK